MDTYIVEKGERERGESRKCGRGSIIVHILADERHSPFLPQFLSMTRRYSEEAVWEEQRDDITSTATCRRLGEKTRGKREIRREDGGQRGKREIRREDQRVEREGREDGGKGEIRREDQREEREGREDGGQRGKGEGRE